MNPQPAPLHKIGFVLCVRGATIALQPLQEINAPATLIALEAPLQYQHALPMQITMATLELQQQLVLPSPPVLLDPLQLRSALRMQDTLVQGLFLCVQ